VFFILARAELAAGAGLGLGYVSLAAVGVAAYGLCPRPRPVQADRRDRRHRRDHRQHGLFGAPVAATLLGHDELAAAITYDALVSVPMFFVVGFAIAAAFTTRGAAAGLRLRTNLLHNRRSSPSPRRPRCPTRSRPGCSSTSRARR
jgi:hypothetical protein